MSVDQLSSQTSRITIFNEPVICRFCSHDIFIPYEVYVDVEQPGIGVRHMRNVAICQYCGEAKVFGDPSNFDDETGVYIWALDQTLLHARYPELPVIRIVDEATFQGQQKCLLLALQLLVQEKRVVDTVLSLAEDKRYFQLMELLEARTCNIVEEIDAVKCLATATNQLMTHRIVNRDQLLSIVIDESYPGIEVFLKQHLK